MSLKSNPRPLWIGIGVAVVAYALALNPYFIPGIYDDLLYHNAAASIARGDGFIYNGAFVFDWPPMFAWLLAGPHLVGIHSVLVSKLIVLVFVVLGLLAIFQALSREERPYPVLVCLLMAANPKSYQMGTRILSEWPFMTASFVFFALLARMRRERSPRLAIFVGLTLGAAALLRYAGVFLGAALIAEAVFALRAARGNVAAKARAIAPELIAAVTGGALFLLWMVHAYQQKASSAVPVANANFSGSAYASFHPRAVLEAIANVLFASNAFVHTLGASGAGEWLAALLGLAILFALGARLASRRAQASDWYVVVYLGFLCFYEAGGLAPLSRYVFAVAPFLIAYVLEGAASLTRRWGKAGVDLWSRRSGKLAIVAWLGLSVALDAVLLLHGNAEHTHKALAAFRTHDEGAFYDGYWRDLYNACQAIQKVPRDGAVAQLDRKDLAYIIYFSKRPAARANDVDEATFLIAPKDDTLGSVSSAGVKWSALGTFGALSAYERQSNEQEAAH